MLCKSLQRRLRMEMLEDKRPLAANLFANVVNGDLVITGDAGDNRFYIQSGSPDGAQYELGNMGDFTDTINGVPFNSSDHFFSGVTGDIIINLGEGNDWINIMGTNGVTVLNMPRDLKVDMGAGDDRLAFGIGAGALVDGSIAPVAFPLNVARDFSINMGAGNDQSWIAATTVGRDFSYTDSQGDAFLYFLPQYMFDSLATENSSGRDFSIVTGGGADTIILEDTNVGRNLLASVDDGDDYLGVFNVNVSGVTLASLGSGNDYSEFQFSNLGTSLTILGSSGSNSIFVTDVVTSSVVTIVTAKGNDTIVLGGVQTGTAIVTTGAEADELYILDSVFDNLLVTLGGGDDTLTIGGTTVDGLALLLGGGGSDTLVNLGDNDFWLALALSFESQVS